jgi:hypothetical protein
MLVQLLLHCNIDDAAKREFRSYSPARVFSSMAEKRY